MTEQSSRHNWLDYRENPVTAKCCLCSHWKLTQTLCWTTLVIEKAHLSTQVPQPDWFIGAWTNQHLIVLREHQTGDGLSMALVRVQQLWLRLRLDTQLRLSLQVVKPEKGENATQLDLRNFLCDGCWQTGKEMNFCAVHFSCCRLRFTLLSSTLAPSVDKGAQNKKKFVVLFLCHSKRLLLLTFDFSVPCRIRREKAKATKAQHRRKMIVNAPEHRNENQQKKDWNYDMQKHRSKGLCLHGNIVGA